jgi:hypothetical protein
MRIETVTTKNQYLVVQIRFGIGIALGTLESSFFRLLRSQRFT